MKRRVASEDEKNLFRKTIDHARPKLAVPVKAKKPPAKGKPGGSGLDGNTRKRLQRGALAPEARLDLHGFNQETAHRGLLSFLRAAHKNDIRLALVITGKGGILKEMVPRWLSQSPFAALIAGTESAHIRHGGAGALYVYLRK